MTDAIANQIRLGLDLVAEDVQAPARTRASRRPSLRVAAVAVAVAVLAAGVLFGIVSRGSAPAARFVTDRFDYRPGGVGGRAAFPLVPYSVTMLSAADASSAQDAWAVGGNVAWHWDGSTWRTFRFPAVRGFVDLGSVATAGDGEAWAVGSRDDPADDRVVHALVEHWDGSRWRVVPVPSPKIANLHSVSASGPTNVWASGVSFHRDSSGRFPERGIRPLLLHWDGTAWTKVFLPWRLSSPYEATKVVTTGPTDVWVINAEQVEHWDGASWNRIPAPFGPRDHVWGFSATAPDDVWAVGNYVHGRQTRTLAAHWDGQAWQIAPTPNPSTYASLYDVVAVNPDDVWAVGQSASYGKSPIALLEHWDGESWQIMPGEMPSLLDGTPTVAATQDGTAWAIGSCYFDNFLLRWDGSAWRIARHPRDQRWEGRARRHHRGFEFGHCHVPRG